MSLQTRLTALVAAIGADVKKVNVSMETRIRVGDVGCIGDSITANNGVAGISNEVLSGQIIFGPLSWLGMALAQTGGKFRFGMMSATAGYTSTQILTTHLPNAVTAAPSVCTILAGTNDVGVVATATTISNIKSMVTQLVAKGTLPILCTIPPQDAATGTVITAIVALNTWLRRYAREQGYPLADFHSVLVDPANGKYLTGYSSDGTHPTGLGAATMAAELARVLNSLSARSDSQLLDCYQATGALIKDVCFTASDTWGIAGNATSGWSLVSLTGPNWKGAKLVVTRGSAGDYFVLSNVAPASPGTLVSGRRVRFAAVVDAPTVPVGGSWSFVLTNTSDSTVVCGYSGITQPMTNATGNPVVVFEFVVPASVAAKTTLVAEYMVQGAAGVVLGVAQATLIDITALGAL